MAGSCVFLERRYVEHDQTMTPATCCVTMVGTLNEDTTSVLSCFVLGSERTSRQRCRDLGGVPVPLHSAPN